MFFTQQQHQHNMQLVNKENEYLHKEDEMRRKIGDLEE